MLQVAERLKKLYQSDSVDKNLYAEFSRPGEVPFLKLWDSRHFLSGSLVMEEALSSDENLGFGSCEATQLKLTLIDVDEAIQGVEMAVYQTLDVLSPAADLYPGADCIPSGFMMPLGRYVIKSADKQANRRYRDIVALDYMCKFDTDVIDWYNSLPFPLSLRDFRRRLCQHVGVTEHVSDYLPNDSLLIEKTIDAAELMGRDVLVACEQLNGVFGHFDRLGVLRHVALQGNYSLVPSRDLCPGGDVFPVLPGEMNEQVFDEKIDQHLHRSCHREEYTVNSIDKVQIRQEEGDIGAIYGTGSNCLTVEGNFLVYGKTAAELNRIAANLYGMVSGRPYIPFECELKGLPYLEVGDTELIDFGGDHIVSYIVKRTLKGDSALRDTHSATGEEIRSTEHNVNTEIIQLKGRAAILKKNVDEVSANLIDLEKRTEAKFTITAEQIAAEVKRAADAEAALKISADEISMSVKNLQTSTESRFTQTANQITAEVKRATDTEAALAASIKVQADQIELKVSKNGVSNALSLETDKVKITGNRLIVESENFQLDGSGNAVFSGEVKGAKITGSRIYCKGGQFEADDDTVYIGGFYTFSTNYGNYLASNDQSTGIGDYGRYAFWSGWDGRQADETKAESITSHYGVCISDQAVFIKDDAYIRGCSLAQGTTRLWGIGETLDWLNSKVNALANIIDDQWSDYSGVRSALRDWEG